MTHTSTVRTAEPAALPHLDVSRVQELDATLLDHHQADLSHVGEQVGRTGRDARDVIDELARFSVAAPSWAVGTGGTRFGRFPVGGEPRDLTEKLEDLSVLQRLSGANRTVSLHIPWDLPEDPDELRALAEGWGLGFDAINSNTFQDHPSTTDDGRLSYKFGSMSSADPAVRAAAVEHNLEVMALGDRLGSRALSVWLGDGTNHPGQADFRRQFDRVADCLSQLHDALPPGWLLFTEHKPFEPAFYSTVNADWGSSLLLAQRAGERAKCLVDLGHHLPNANIEQIVSRLAMVDRLAGFHFNDSKYGDDDLTTGSVHPYQLFLIVLELVRIGDGAMPDLAYMLDQSHNLKDPVEDLLQATDAAQVAVAQALLVDLDELDAAQDADDPARAAEVLAAAYRTDVRPLVAEARRRNGAALDPVRAFRASGYRAATVERRGHGHVATGL